MFIYQLEGFYYVGKHKGFSLAARNMPYPIGEPAVHQQVKVLQQDLGVRLVERVKGAGIQLTPEGRALHAFIAPFFEGLAPFERGFKAGQTGQLIVVAPRIILTDWFPSKLTALRKILPQATWHLREENDNRAVAPLIVNGTADIGINYFPELPRTLTAMRVATFEAFAAMLRRHPLASKRSLTLLELATHPLILYERGSVPRALFDEAAAKERIAPIIAIEATTSEAMLRLVAAGLGVAIIPRIREAIDEGMPASVRCVPIRGLLAPQPIHVVTRLTPVSPLVRRAADALAS